MCAGQPGWTAVSPAVVTPSGVNLKLIEDKVRTNLLDNDFIHLLHFRQTFNDSSSGYGSGSGTS